MKEYDQLEFTNGACRYFIIFIIGIVLGFAFSIMTF